jgi:hypothetical protein
MVQKPDRYPDTGQKGHEQCNYGRVFSHGIHSSTLSSLAGECTSARDRPRALHCRYHLCGARADAERSLCGAILATKDMRGAILDEFSATGYTRRHYRLSPTNERVAHRRRQCRRRLRGARTLIYQPGGIRHDLQQQAERWGIL